MVASPIPRRSGIPKLNHLISITSGILPGGPQRYSCHSGNPKSLKDLCAKNWGQRRNVFITPHTARHQMLARTKQKALSRPPAYTRAFSGLRLFPRLGFAPCGHHRDLCLQPRPHTVTDLIPKSHGSPAPGRGPGATLAPGTDCWNKYKRVPTFLRPSPTPSWPRHLEPAPLGLADSERVTSSRL